MCFSFEKAQSYRYSSAVLILHIHTQHTSDNKHHILNMYMWCGKVLYLQIRGSIQKTTFCGFIALFIALLKEVLDFGGQLKILPLHFPVLLLNFEIILLSTVPLSCCPCLCVLWFSSFPLASFVFGVPVAKRLWAAGTKTRDERENRLA